MASPEPVSLRVCMVVHNYYEGDARVRRYAESLAALGHRVEVLALRAKGLPARETLRGVRLYRLPVTRRRGSVLRYLWEYFGFAMLCWWWLTWRTLARRFHVVHVHNMPDFLVFTALLPRLCGSRVVLDVHDLMPEVYCSKYRRGLRHPSLWPVRIQERLSHAFASAVVFATDEFRRRALDRRTVRPARAAAVMNAADTVIFDRLRHPWRGPERPDEFRLLYLGTVSHRHGVDQCVRVLPLVRAAIPGVRLRLHCKLAEGEGRPLQELRELAAQLGVQDLLEIGPPLPLTEVPAAMAQCSCGVFTPHRDLHIDMALSLKVPEFVAMDVPVVTVRTPIMTSLFREDEVLMFEAEDLDGFAACLRRLHTEPGLRAELTRKARRFTVEHSWASEFANYTTLLEGLLGRSVAVPERQRG
jgi:glycosyltransferase involved in cell wall biosynthesis